jgi:hypothetical protein
MKKLLIILLFPALAWSGEVIRTCVSIEFQRTDNGEWISCNEAREEVDNKALMLDVERYCNV